MQHHPRIELMRRALRSAICTQCYERPLGSESLGPQTPRSCEEGCAIFASLPRLIRIAHKQQGDPHAPYEWAMREIICSQCNLTPSAGDYCAEQFARTCPLSRYGREALHTLERFTERPSRVA